MRDDVSHVDVSVQTPVANLDHGIHQTAVRGQLLFGNEILVQEAVGSQVKYQNFTGTSLASGLPIVDDPQTITFVDLVKF